MARNKDQMFWFDMDVFEDALNGYVDDMQKIVKKAIYSTMARVRQNSRTVLSAKIREKWNISKKDLDVHLRVKIGSRGDAYESFEMTIKGNSLSLSMFKITQYSGNRVSTTRKSHTTKRRSSFQGIKAEVVKGKTVKLSRSFLHAKGSTVRVLRRKGKARNPVALRVVVSPATIYSNDKYHDWFTDHVVEFIDKEFKHQLDYRLSQAGYL